MLKALYDYALAHDLTLPDGYVKKTVAAYLCFSSRSESFVELWMGDTRLIPCPDVGSLANGTEKSNVIVEKRSVVLPEAENAKSRFFKQALEQLGETDPDARLCAERLADPEIVSAMREKLDAKKIKASQRISFMVDDRKLLDSPHLLAWWQAFRREILPPRSGEMVPCLITGEPTHAVATVPPISGLHAVGGHARGDALICFDKPAFCSYGLKQAANAPVSESAMSAVKAALDALLSEAPTLAGMKFVHWYDREVPKDPLQTENESDLEDDYDQDEEQEEIDAVAAADRLVCSPKEGTQSPPLDANYHILLLSGVGGRVMIRRYERGRYEDLQEKLAQWNRDLTLVNAVGSGKCKPLKLTGRLIRLMKYQKSDKNTYERLGKELAGITPAVLTAILHGGRLPDAVALRALAYTRSKLLAAEPGEQENGRIEDNLDGWACQWLKVWLIRHREGGDTMLKEEYNVDHREPAYHCGGAMAVYAAIQRTAMRDVNASVVQRYYASCIQTPALVLGRLSQLSVHHIEKIRYPSVAEFYRTLLETVNRAIGDQVPTTLDLEKQSYFALGYYQMSAYIRKEIRERIQAAKRNVQEGE